VRVADDVLHEFQWPGRHLAQKAVAGEFGAVALDVLGAHRGGGVYGRRPPLLIQPHEGRLVKQRRHRQGEPIHPPRLHLGAQRQPIGHAHDAQRMVEEERVVLAQRRSAREHTAGDLDDRFDFGHGTLRVADSRRFARSASSEGAACRVLADAASRNNAGIALLPTCSIGEIYRM
jgi:hypothetical protein